MATKVFGPPPHSKRVQAWVYAILNPVIEGLRREASLLEIGNLTWRFYSRRCEYIRPVAEYIESDQLPNLEDFLGDDLNPGFASRFAEHDDLVLIVESSASVFFDRLLRSDIFSQQVQATLKEYESAISLKPQYPPLDSMRNDLPKYIAEYLINRADVLPAHYTTHKFWEEFRNKFERSTDEFAAYQQRESYLQLQDTSRRLVTVSQGLLLGAKHHRQFLCSAFDISAAPLPTA